LIALRGKQLVRRARRGVSFWAGTVLLSVTGVLWAFFFAVIIANGAGGSWQMLLVLLGITVVAGPIGMVLVRLGRKSNKG
jgi:hypothetical protein